MLVTTTAVQYAAWSQGRKAPVIAIPSTRTKSPTPVTQCRTRRRGPAPPRRVPCAAGCESRCVRRTSRRRRSAGGPLDFLGEAVLDEERGAVDAMDVLGQGLGWRATHIRAVDVVQAAVTGAKELAQRNFPSHRALHV